MTLLPANLALTNIAPNAAILSADHRTNYSAIQAYTNALNALLAGGAAGDVLGGVGTTLTWAKPPDYEYTYSQIVANATVSGTSGAQQTIIGPTAGVTFDGATAVYIEIFAPACTAGTSDAVVCELYEDATSIGIVSQITAGGAVSPGSQIVGRLKRTPSAASHTYTWKAYRTTNNGTIFAAAGGAGAYVPAHIRVVKV